MLSDVEFQDVSYMVRLWNYKVNEPKKKNLLQRISGSFKNGQLSAILGSSGAGKTSLLNAVSGLRTAGITGKITTQKKISCYLTKEDNHHPFLSVNELMTLACNLKFKGGTMHEPIITEVLRNLNLDQRRSALTKQLSGGEKRRLSIALELVSDPTIFFLDEPVTGLDYSSAVQCIRLLKLLVQRNKTIICTIHQPSALMLSLFDQIFVIAKGQCVFQGGPKTIVPYLSQVNLICPTNYNPCDYIIELCADDAVLSTLTDLIQNGKRMCILDEVNQCNTVTFTTNNEVTPMLEIPATRGYSFVKKKEKLKNIRKENDVSVSRQFIVLFHFMLLKNYRNRFALTVQIFHHALCGFVLGGMFFNGADDGERMFDHLKIQVFIAIFITYSQMVIPTVTFPSEVKLLKKECFNRWYGFMPYYMALTLSRLPLQIFCNVIFLSSIYWMVGFPAQAFRYGLFILIGLYIAFIAEGMGLLIGSIFTKTIGSLIGVIFTAVLLGLTIYGVDFAKEVPLIMYAAMKLSYTRIGVVAMGLTIFGFNRPKLSCSDLYCHYDDPKVLLKFLCIDEMNVWVELGFLITYGVIVRTICYFTLRRRIRS